jgi:hypothetical protein
VLTLGHPQLAVAYRQDVGTMISGAANDSNIVVPICEEEPSNVALERLPRAIQEPTMIQKAL